MCDKECYKCEYKIGHCAFLNADLMNNEKIELIEKERKEMSLRERILAKLDYEAIAREVYNQLESTIEEAVVTEIDEEAIANDLVYHFEDEFTRLAVDIVTEELAEHINIDDVKEEFKDVIKDEI